MKGFSLALLVLTAFDEYAFAFTPSSFGGVKAGQRHSMVVDMSTETDDVSIPYDAAARYTYEEWCKTYGKDVDESRYPTFKDNYEAITVMNVSAKKAGRESGDENPSLLALNEFADCTGEEYEAMMNNDAPSSAGILDKAVAAAESQMEASSALQDAADALAEEEEVGLGPLFCMSH